jgi:AraC-like DNA-binding protein
MPDSVSGAEGTRIVETRQVPVPRPDPPRGLLNLDPVAGPVRMARYLPSPPLAHLVEHYWGVRWDLRGHPEFQTATLPYPSVHVVLQEGRWTITGVLTSRRFERTLRDVGAVFGIKFTPGGFRPYVAESVASFTDCTVEASPILPLVHELPTSAGQPDAALVERAESVLLDHLPALDGRVTQVGRMVQTIAQRREIVRVEQVVPLSGMSLRALQRLFREYVGVGPKWVIQRYRLFEAAERLTAGDVDGAQVAHELGYFDQAHFIRDFKSMVGRSPRAFASEIR